MNDFSHRLHLYGRTPKRRKNWFKKIYSKPEHYEYRNKNIHFSYNITCMRACVPFQVKSIIESFAAECT